MADSKIPLTAYTLAKASALADKASSSKASDAKDLSPEQQQLLAQATASLLSQQRADESVQETDESQKRQSSKDVHYSDAFLEFYHRARFSVTKSTTPAGPGYTYSHAPKTRYGDQQSDPHRRVQIQINFLDTLAARVPSLSSLSDEMRAKEDLRERLTKIASDAIETYAIDLGYGIGIKPIDLKCFGSLRNGFALPNSNLDLVMKPHATLFPMDLEPECPRIFLKAFLDAGLDAELISKTRFLRKWSASRTLSSTNCRSSRTAPCSDGRIPILKVSDTSSNVNCDINFSEILALHNTELLRAYALCDERIRSLGAFVKMWAKARKINSPCDGTLCSYGYILMVIHYVTNVASPPLVPNLQHLCPPKESDVGDVQGCDVRFFNNEQKLKHIAKFNRTSGNRQSVGELIRGFFAYYGSYSSTSTSIISKGGFEWSNSTISIRTLKGLISKTEKGWDRARTDEAGNRLRFLLAIEDPFEHNHNVARTVTMGGLIAIRAEFRRAQFIVHNIQEIPGSGWEWRTEAGEVGEDFLAEERSYRRPMTTHHSREPKNAGGIAYAINERLKSILKAAPRPQKSSRERPNSTSTTATAAKCSSSKASANRPSGLTASTLTSGPNYNPLIRPEPSPEVQRKQTRQRQFQQQTASVASRMRDLLSMPESAQQNETPSSNQWPSKPPSHIRGFRIDPNQFKSPSAITDRPPARLVRLSGDADSDLDTEFGSVFDVGQKEFLENLPFGHGTQS